MSSASFYKWRSKYGGMDAALMSRREELETENARLKKMYAEERLKAEVVREALEKSGEAISSPRDGRRPYRRAVHTKRASVTSRPIFHGHPDTARSSAYAAYETPVPSKGNNKFTGVAFFVTSQTESFGSTGNFVVGFDFGIEAHFPGMRWQGMYFTR
ncbi:hypothetical protein bAD24_I10765 [Burkholderia sp. AD24]|nr:hypothetical protein bAD24_I10765 [Burkholderia sp. AD24]